MFTKKKAETFNRKYSNIMPEEDQSVGMTELFQHLETRNDNNISHEIDQQSSSNMTMNGSQTMRKTVKKKKKPTKTASRQTLKFIKPSDTLIKE